MSAAAIIRRTPQAQLIDWTQNLGPLLAEAVGAKSVRIVLTHHGAQGSARRVGIWPIVSEDTAEQLAQIAEDVYRCACEDAQAYEGPQRYAAALYLDVEDPNPTVRRAFRVVGRSEMDGEIMPTEPASTEGLTAMAMRHAEAYSRQMVLQQQATTEATVRVCHEVSELLAHERDRRAGEDERRDRELGRLMDQVDRWMGRFFESVTAREQALSRQQEREIERLKFEHEARMKDRERDEQFKEREHERADNFVRSEWRRAALDRLMSLAGPLVMAVMSKNQPAIDHHAGELVAAYQRGELNFTRTTAPPSTTNEAARDAPTPSEVPPVEDDPVVRAHVKQVIDMLGPKIPVAIHELVSQLPPAELARLLVYGSERWERMRLESAATTDPPSGNDNA